MSHTLKILTASRNSSVTSNIALSLLTIHPQRHIPSHQRASIPKLASLTSKGN